MSGLRPGVVALLATIPTSSSRHAALDLRVPLGAFNSSLREAVAAFTATLDEVERVRSTSGWMHDKGSWSTPYTKAYEHLLYTLFEHLETSRNILRCFSTDDDAFKRQAATRAYDKGIGIYRKHLGAVVNSIKHKQRRIGGIVIYNDEVSIPGYYVEASKTLGPNKHPIIQPDPDIHRDGDSAFSTHRDLRLHFVYVYFVARHLATALESLGLSLSESRAVESKEMDDQLFEVARRIADLPTVFYPDEIFESVPAVGAGQLVDGEKTIWVDFPSSRIRPTTLKHSRISISYHGDGAHDTFKVPYSTAGRRISGVYAPGA